MKIFQINATCGKGSTGRICVEISKLLSENGIENNILYTSGHSDYPNGICYSSKFLEKVAALSSHITGYYGFQSFLCTRKLLRILKKGNPDIVHLHNLHGHNVNLTMLFRFLKKQKIKTIWTFHDCWAFTGYCPHFTMANCDKWKTLCRNCPSYHDYSFFFDRSQKLFEKKKKLFSGLDMTIVVPSQWLADMVSQSFLKQYPIKVIRNGIDLDVFSPKETDFRQRYNISKNQKIILGVSDRWGIKKGIDVFINLSSSLDSDKYKIVLVGTDDKIDKILPKKILSIHRTDNQTELAEIYSAADWFINPTREENYPTVNMEAIACATPVITFKTGGSPEMIFPDIGAVVPVNDVEALKNIILTCDYKNQTAKGKYIQVSVAFDKKNTYCNYLKLYSSMT